MPGLKTSSLMLGKLRNEEVEDEDATPMSPSHASRARGPSGRMLSEELVARDMAMSLVENAPAASSF